VLNISVEKKVSKKNALDSSMEKHLASLSKKEIFAGFFEESKYPTDSTRHKGVAVAQVAKWQNDGTIGGNGNIPPRPFMDLAALEIKDSRAFKKALTQPVIKTLTKTGSNTAKLKVANLMKEIIQLQILNFSEPKNSERTIELKGFNDPLIETGRMYDSVKGKVR